MSNQNGFPTRLLLRFEVELPPQSSGYSPLDLRGIREHKDYYEDYRPCALELPNVCPASLQQVLEGHYLVVQRITSRKKRDGLRSA